MIIVRAPFRASLFGGGTDYPEWFHRHGGRVLAVALNKYCYVTVRRLPPFLPYRYRAAYSRVETCMEVGEIRHPAVREAFRMWTNGPTSVAHDSDLPARSGIGSGSSFVVALLLGLLTLNRQPATPESLASLAIFMERTLLRENVGYQDQISAAYGGMNHIDFHRDPLSSGRREWTITPVELSPDTRYILQEHLSLVYTGVERTSSDVVATYIDSLLEKEQVLKRLGQMVEEGEKALGDPRALGELLHESWMLKREMGTAMTTDQIDQVYQAARAAGALGGKLLGGGGGGFMLLVVPPGMRTNVRQALSGLSFVPFGIDDSGARVIYGTEDDDASL